ncbi:MAG: hypothetical protein IH597_04860 [Bacteroidales bacterium]|nr:hypothetical protein [Bacteroidales bacterium]
MRSIPFLIIIIVALLFGSCKKDKQDEATARIQIQFEHKVDGEPLIKDQMIYTNAAGNVYEVTEVMYFISDLKLHRNDGTVVEPATWDDIYYVDTNIPSTFTWNLPGDIPAGIYDSITFIFGISEEKNESFMFVNPPEVNMAWPDMLGGGYHYMMLNGWWLDPDEVRRSFNFHLGIGQIYESDSITGFVQNYFKIKLNGPGFEVVEEMLIIAELSMNIQNWFKNPHIYDHNHWGGAIMQNQAAMQMGCENGIDVFTVEYQFPLQLHQIALE